MAAKKAPLKKDTCVICEEVGKITDDLKDPYFLEVCPLGPVHTRRSACWKGYKKKLRELEAEKKAAELATADG